MLYKAGDFNARTRDFRDYIPTDNLDVLYHEVVDYESATFDLPRRNKDIIRYNNFGRTLVDLCCTYNIHILNGRCSDDSDGNYTCIVNEGHSVVDYHLASSELFPFISYFNVEMRDVSQITFLCCHT